MKLSCFLSGVILSIFLATQSWASVGCPSVEEVKTSVFTDVLSDGDPNGIYLAHGDMTHDGVHLNLYAGLFLYEDLAISIANQLNYGIFVHR